MNNQTNPQKIATALRKRADGIGPSEEFRTSLRLDLMQQIDNEKRWWQYGQTRWIVSMATLGLVAVVLLAVVMTNANISNQDVKVADDNSSSSGGTIPPQNIDVDVEEAIDVITAAINNKDLDSLNPVISENELTVAFDNEVQADQTKEALQVLEIQLTDNALPFDFDLLGVERQQLLNRFIEPQEGVTYVVGISANELVLLIAEIDETGLTRIVFEPYQLDREFRLNMQVGRVVIDRETDRTDERPVFTTDGVVAEFDLDDELFASVRFSGGEEFKCEATYGTQVLEVNPVEIAPDLWQANFTAGETGTFELKFSCAHSVHTNVAYEEIMQVKITDPRVKGITDTEQEEQGGNVTTSVTVVE